MKHKLFSLTILVVALVIVIGVPIALVSVPRTANAQGILTSFGGNVIMAITCSGGVWFTIRSSRGIDLGAPEAYIWTPATKGMAPSHFGQWIKGLSSASSVCYVGIYPLYGIQVFTDQVGA